VIPKISQETLAEMIGTTRSRVSFFLNKFSRLLARVGLVHERHWVEGEDPDFDIGCIHLDEPIGNQIGWFQVVALPADGYPFNVGQLEDGHRDLKCRKARPRRFQLRKPEALMLQSVPPYVDTPADELQEYLVNISGYPGDRGAGAEQYHHRNRVLRVTARRLFYEVDTYGGQSGAPVWIHEDEQSPPIIVGIHAYGVGGTPQDWGISANSAPRIIPEVLDQIEGWVNEDGG
jgi:hypothetical protein